MPADLGPPHGSPSEATKSEALEAVAGRRRLTREHAEALSAVGILPTDRAGQAERPWGSADDATAKRLARVRGWSPAAIAAFLHRTEAQVQAALAGTTPTRVGRRP